MYLQSDHNFILVVELQASKIRFKYFAHPPIFVQDRGETTLITNLGKKGRDDTELNA
jgi:hypothetical protein